MANRQQKRQPPRNTTNIVVRNGSSSNQAGSSRAQQARRRRNRRKPQVNIRVLASQNKVVRRNTRRPGVGGRVVFQKISTTLGTVGSNGSDQIECEMTCVLNPATMKEATGSNNFGPLGIYASTYALYKMTRCELRFKPLVGDSAVSGTICRASWNPTATPSQTSWSSLGARKHVDVTPGKTGRLVLTARDLAGPRNGWYKTNTQGDPMMALAGALEIHTLGKTMSTYQNAPFTGGLFIVEVLTEWQFKDYQQQPGLVNLLKGEDKQQATIETGEGNKLQLVLPTTSRMGRAATTTASDIIWIVSDTIIQLGTTFIPPPFSWLIRGGWWIVKRAAGAPTRNGEVRFDIYASISDARSSSPCVVQEAISDPVPVGNLHFQQLTPGNTGIGTDLPMVRSIDHPTQGTPTQCYTMSPTRMKMGTTEGENYVPAFCDWYGYGNQSYDTGIGFLVGNDKIATYNLYKVSISTDVGPVTLDSFTNQVPFYLFHGNTREQIGYAVASRYGHIQTNPALRVTSVLFYATKNQAYNFAQTWKVVSAQYPVTHQNDTNKVKLQITQTQQGATVRLKFNTGSWYVAQFVVWGNTGRHYKVGDATVAFRGAGQMPTSDEYFVPTTEDSLSGALPIYISSLQLHVFTASTVRSDETSARGRDPLECDPSFGCDDALEFPSTLNEQEPADDEDEFEDPEDLEEDEDEELELGPDDHYSDPPLSRLVVRPEAQLLYENLAAQFSDREARLAVNQLHPSDEYSSFTELYHDALADGLSPREARAHALGL
ncbi:ORF2 [Mamastrovirus 3]|uniref:ORF2 n=1 Tax=Porcine astrovirus 1 TaxID=1239567 RepID=A0A238TME4_PASV1|nr:ORF2 [Mamastrovirus 3]